MKLLFDNVKLTVSPAVARHIKTVAFWTAPPLILLVLYWPGLMTWFWADDFAWLGLRGYVHTWHDLWWALFAPLSQGTIRTLSERVFFMSFSTLFGLHALPYRCWVFLTGAITLVLMSSVCTKLTGSRAAGFWAAILWTVNGTIAFVFSWTAIYYELLCAFFLLLSFWLLLRYVETGKLYFYVAQCITFILGFGVLELNVVYPALALAYALCCARHIIGKILPLFIFSAAYTWVHLSVAPLVSSGPYKMFWNASIVSTFWTYWKFALGPNRLIVVGIYPSLFRSALAFILMSGLLGFLAWKLLRREWLAAFFPVWFIIVLAPLLPLRDHISDYYLTIPLIGLAMLGSWAFVSGWRAGRVPRTAALVLLALYLCVSVPVARMNSLLFYERSHYIRRVVFDVVGLSRSYPNRMILLKGVDSRMFWDTIYGRPFRLFGIDKVYLLAEHEVDITPGLQPETVQSFFMDVPQARSAVDQNRAAIFDVSREPVRDVTAAYRPLAAAR